MLVTLASSPAETKKYAKRSRHAGREITVIKHSRSEITVGVSLLSWRGADEAALHPPRNHVPHDDLAITAAGGQEGRGAVSRAQDFLPVALLLRQDRLKSSLLKNWQISAHLRETH